MRYLQVQIPIASEETDHLRCRLLIFRPRLRSLKQAKILTMNILRPCSS